MLSISLFAFSPVQATTAELTGAEPATGLFQISPDSQYVVYAANKALGDSFLHLYSAPLSGGEPVLLNLPLPEARIFGYAISADGQRVVYQSDADLYSVSITGPAAASVKLNYVALVGSVQHTFSLSPDGKFVVYRTNDDLYSVPVEGPAEASVKLNIAAPLAPDFGRSGVDAADFAITPDSQRVVYVAQTGLPAFSLYSAPIDGPASASVQLSIPTPGADIDWFTISSDSRYIVYLSDHGVGPERHQETDSRFELYSAPVAGPADMGAKLNVPLAEGESIYAVTVSAEATHVVYVKGYELYSAPIAGPADASIRLDNQQTASRIDNLEISADGQWVVFQIGDLYSVPISGPAAAVTKLTDVMATSRVVGQFHISPDSQYVVYSGYETTTSPLELFRVPIQGPTGAGVKINRPLATAEQPLYFQISPDSQSVVYAAHQDDAQKNELYGAPLAGTAEQSVKLSSEVEGAGVRPLHWQISKDSRWLVYAAGMDLYVANLDELDWIIAGDDAQTPQPWHTYLPVMPRAAD
jgi:dipeptidyl aminopeptidase/acylaminoacyl peptidase